MCADLNVSKRKKLWLGGIALVVLILAVGAYVAASMIARNI